MRPSAWTSTSPDRLTKAKQTRRYDSPVPRQANGKRKAVAGGTEHAGQAATDSVVAAFRLIESAALNGHGHRRIGRQPLKRRQTHKQWRYHVRLFRLTRSGFRHWLPGVLAVIAFGALLVLDASVPAFSSYWVQHALSTTLVGAVVFAFVAALMIDRIVTARSRRARKLISSSEVKAVADMTWVLASHPCWLASNLRHPGVRATAQGELHQYQLFLVNFTHSHADNPALRQLIRELIRFSFHLEDLLVTLTQIHSGSEGRVRALEIQAGIDALAWAHYRDDVADNYWENGERFTTDVRELPPEYTLIPHPIARSSPDGRYTTRAPAPIARPSVDARGSDQFDF